MQQLYVLRRFSSWSFRLSMSMALLLSSAGLAATLLVSVTAQEAGVAHLTWQPSPNFSQTASELAIDQRAVAQALPVSLSSMVPSYSFATTTAYSAPPFSLASGRFAAPEAGAEAAYVPTTKTFKTTVQRSWDTFKLAFR